MIQTFSSFSSLFLKRWCCFVSHMEIFYLYLKKNWAYSTEYSQAVTHPSTNSAQCCLTSVIGRELVFSTWYGRRHFGLNDWAIDQPCLPMWTKICSSIIVWYTWNNERWFAHNLLHFQWCLAQDKLVVKKTGLQHRVFPGGHPSKY